MLTDPVFEPWREEARKRGYASSLVLPLITKGKPFGAISIYSKEPDSFADSEINLLSDLADDLAYGISYIRLKEAERAATMVIKKSEAQLKELNATKDKFFNIIAHDLKNPFTSLLGSSELLYNNINKMAPENIKKLSLILNDSAKGGYAILLNLLDWSRSQTGILKYKPEKINLKNLIDENISNLQLSAANKEIRLFSEIKDNLFVNADKNMINTLLRNLLNNAVKFTHRNGKVVIGAVTDSKNVIISVKDTGLGISEDKIEKLFRIDTKHSMPGTENEQGTGLGLKLCQEFVDKMGGKIWVESVENKGSTFKFSIPVKEGRLH
jgi:signal transduction histidine kinase